MKVPALINEQRIQAVFLTDNPKFLYRPGLHFSHLRNHPAAQSALCLHPPLVAPKEPPLNRSRNEIGKKKK